MSEVIGTVASVATIPPVMARRASVCFFRA
jgi:hypothetical protein